MQATLLALTLIATGTTAEPTADSIAAQATAPLTFNVGRSMDGSPSRRRT